MCSMWKNAIFLLNIYVSFLIERVEGFIVDMDTKFVLVQVYEANDASDDDFIQVTMKIVFSFQKH